MKNSNNEKGMALVTVLLMITVFTILGMTVISLSISNTKQVAKTEQEMQAVDIAEMGVLYYKNVFIKEADEKLTNAIGGAITTINDKNNIIIEENKNKNNPQPLIELNFKNIWNTIKENNSLPENRSFYLEEGTSTKTFQKNITVDKEYKLYADPHVKLVDNDYDPKKIEIEITFNSIGRSSDDEANITGTILLDIDELIKTYLNTGGTGNIITKDMIIVKPILPTRDFKGNLGFEGNGGSDGYSYTKDITNYNFDIINKTAILNGSFGQNYGNSIIQDSFLYITNSAFNTTTSAFFGNSQKYPIRGLRLFVGGNTSFHNAKAGIKDSIFYIDGDLTFHNQVGTISNSKFCVRGNINSKNNNFPSPAEAWSEGEYKCILFKNISNTPGSNLLETIAGQVDNLTLKYH